MQITSYIMIQGDHLSQKLLLLLLSLLLLLLLLLLYFLLFISKHWTKNTHEYTREIFVTVWQFIKYNRCKKFRQLKWNTNFVLKWQYYFRVDYITITYDYIAFDHITDYVIILWIIMNYYLNGLYQRWCYCLCLERFCENS